MEFLMRVVCKEALWSLIVGDANHIQKALLILRVLAEEVEYSSTDKAARPLQAAAGCNSSMWETHPTWILL